MANLLTPEEQDRILRGSIALTLDNFSLAWRIADVLIEYMTGALPPPQATVTILGQRQPVTIPGKNCGFFTTPVIQMAILDCRRSLEFFGLTCDSTTQKLKPIERRRNDDLGIEHFGLPWVTTNQMADSGTNLEVTLSEIHHWSNKQLAHFTIAQPSITLDSIRDASKAMIDVYLRFLFDALGRDRPQIQPVNA